MRVGIPWWIGHGDPSEGVARAADHGFDLIEVSLDAPWPEGLSAPALAEACAARDVVLGLHAPWRTQGLAHPRAQISDAAHAVLGTCLDFAAQAGAEYLVVHADARDYAGFPRADVVAAGVDRAMDHLMDLARRTPEVEVLLENTSPPFGTPDECRSALERVPGIGFCFDPGHAALVFDYGTEGASEDVATWMDAVGERLRLLHLMDYTRTEHGVFDHLVPDAGSYDVPGLVDAAREAGCERVLIEAFFTDIDRTEASIGDIEKSRSTVPALG